MGTMDCYGVFTCKYIYFLDSALIDMLVGGLHERTEEKSFSNEKKKKK